MGSRIATRLHILCISLICITWMSGCGGGPSTLSPLSHNPLGQPVSQSNPVPTLNSFSPPSAQVGAAGFQLTLNGSNFMSGCALYWNGSPRTTTLVSCNQLAAEIPASDISGPGIAHIMVINPAPGGGTSSTFRFGITGPVAAEHFLYVSDDSTNQVFVFAIDANTGALTAAPGSPYLANSQITQPGILLLDRLGQFLYLENAATTGCKPCESFDVFSIGDGRHLTPVTGSPVGSSGLGNAAVEDPSGNIIYSLAVFTNPSLSARRIDATSGVPIMVGTGLNLDSEQIASIAIHPAGSFIYVADQNGGIWGIAVNLTSGALSIVPGSPFGAPTGFGTSSAPWPVLPSAIALDVSGKFLFALHTNRFIPGLPDEVVSFSVNAASGALSYLTSANGAPGVTNVQVHPSNKFLYITESGNNTVLGFTIGSDGSLTQIPGSPFALDAPNSLQVLSPTALAIDPSGNFLYTANVMSDNVSALQDSNTGGLSPVPGSPFSLSNPPTFSVQGPVSLTIGP